MVFNIETLSQQELLRLLLHINDKYAIEAIDATRIRGSLTHFMSIKPIQGIVVGEYSTEEILTTPNNMADDNHFIRQNVYNEDVRPNNAHGRGNINPSDYLGINMEDYQQRADRGKTHRKWVHTGYRIGMYNLDGKLEQVFDDMADAVKNNPVGANYKGILHCINGNVKKHAGKIWRKTEDNEKK